MISGVSLKNFRSYKEAVFEFGDFVNIIVGPNGSGKTSLIESLHIVARGKSFKGDDRDLLQKESDWTRIDATTGDNNTITIKLVRSSDDQKIVKTFQKNDKVYKKVTSSLKMPVIVFEPPQVSIITGEPEKRRDYLDTILSYQNPEYDNKLTRYKRILFQRNRLLKQPNSNDSMFFVWDVQLAELGTYITENRKKLASKINESLGDYYRDVSGSEESVSFTYNEKTKHTNGQNILKHLQDKLADDRVRGFTSIGPHRDDVVILLGERDAKALASRGEVRSLLLALKRNELSMVEEATGIRPILLLDDVFGELDAKRRRSLAHSLKDYQSFITTTDADVVIDHFTNEFTHIIPIVAN